MTDKPDYYVEENRDHDRRQVHTSPSGRYILTVDSYTTKKGSWDYTRGRVSLADTGTPIADVKRNYNSFPFLWMEDHTNGHDYLKSAGCQYGERVTSDI